MPRKVLLLVTLAVSGLAGCNAQTARPPQPKQTAPAAGEIGSRLPDFSLKDLQGREISSADLRGKVVLIDFWATWCQPCKKEMPGYQKLLDRYGSQGFVVIGFKFDTMKDTEDPMLFPNDSEFNIRWLWHPTPSSRSLVASKACPPRCSMTAEGCFAIK